MEEEEELLSGGGCIRCQGHRQSPKRRGVVDVRLRLCYPRRMCASLRICFLLFFSFFLNMYLKLLTPLESNEIDITNSDLLQQQQPLLFAQVSSSWCGCALTLAWRMPRNMQINWRKRRRPRNCGSRSEFCVFLSKSGGRGWGGDFLFFFRGPGLESVRDNGFTGTWFLKG